MSRGIVVYLLFTLFVVLEPSLGLCAPLASPARKESHPAALSRYDAPFGLKWGASKEELEGIGVKLELETTKGALSSFIARDLPVAVDETDAVELFISDEVGLLRILWRGKEIKNDDHGTAGVREYSRHKDELTVQYGKPTADIQYQGARLFKEPDEFYECLGYDGCGAYSTCWGNGENSVCLELKGLSKGTGYLQIVYERKMYK